MNKFAFLYKFYIYKQRGGHYNWNLLFPFVGVIMGCMTVALTLAIMEGMEYAIFNKLKNISFPAKLTHIPIDSKHEIENLLVEQKIDYLYGIEDQVLIIKDSVFRLTNIHGIVNFKKFRNKVLGDNLQEMDIYSYLPLIYMGRPLANKLKIGLGDTVDISAPKEINIFTGLPLKRKMIVGGIYELEILDYDQKHIFTNYSSVIDFLPDNLLLYYLHEIPEDYFSNAITHDFPGLQFHTWEDEHHSFISAMKIEKIVYSVVGFLIVGIAGFTLMSMMSLSVIQKVPQIGILMAMGAMKHNIAAIFIFQALITWIISSIIGVIFSLIIIEIDKYYHLVQILFPDAVFFDFPLILHYEYVIMILFVSFILLMFSAIYPSIKAANLDAVQATGYKQ